MSKNKKSDAPPSSFSVMPFEKRSEPLASSEQYSQRLTRYFLVASALLLGSLAVGMLGYKYLVGVKGWDDAFLNAAMILTGMGPILDPNLTMTTTGKIFSGLYAIYSGVAFLSSIAIFFSPILHRFLHLMHVDIE